MQFKTKFFLKSLIVCSLFFVCFNFSLAQDLKQQQQEQLNNLQVPFVKNHGQMDDKVEFSVKTFGGTMFVTKKGQIVYSLPKYKQKEIESMARLDEPLNQINEKEIDYVLNLKETLVGSKKNKEVIGEDKAKTKVSYFLGNDREKWKSNNQTFNQLNFGEIYKGITLKLKAYNNNVEKLFYVSAHNDPSQIKLKIEGADYLSINEKTKELEINYLGQKISFTKPVAYQVINNQKKQIEVSYQLINKKTYGFKLGPYDKTKELVIDPLLASTYLGGSENDNSIDLKVDSNGEVYVFGLTSSPDFPVSPGIYDSSLAGNSDFFIAKLDNKLKNLLAATYVGGSDRENTRGSLQITEDSIYLSSSTYSTDFPTTPGSYDRIHNGGWYDMVLFKMDKDLTDLKASTFLGGSGRFDFPTDIEIYNNNIYVIGWTDSNDIETTAGSYDQTFNGSWDIFLGIFSSNLDSLLGLTYVGGSSRDYSRNMVFYENAIYFTGASVSTDFPVTSGAYDESFNGGGANGDVIIGKISADLSTLYAASYLGGSGGGNNDAGDYVLVNDSKVYVTGYTTSSDFPITPGVYDETFNGGTNSGDAFISILNRDLTNLEASTFLGGTQNDRGYYLFLEDREVNIILARSSSDLPVSDQAYSYDLFTLNSSKTSRFWAKLDSDLKNLNFSSYLPRVRKFTKLGDSYYFLSNGLTGMDNALITPGSYDTTHNGNYDTALYKFSSPKSPTVSIDSNYQVQETDGQLEVVFNLNGYGSQPIDLNYTLKDLQTTKDEDYEDVSGTLTIDSTKELSKTLTIPIIDDNKKEANESFQLNISLDYGIIEQDKNFATIVIKDDETPIPSPISSPSPIPSPTPTPETIEIYGTLYRSTHINDDTKRGFKKEKRRDICAFTPAGTKKDCDKTNNKGKFHLKDLKPGHTYYLISSSKRPVPKSYFLKRFAYYKKKYQKTFGKDWIKKFKDGYRIKKAKHSGYPYPVKYYRKYKAKHEIKAQEGVKYKVKMR